MKQIDTLDHWYKFADMLSAGGYRIAPTKGENNSTEGFLVRFIASARPDVEVATSDAAVYTAMLNYRPQGFERG
ncbi:MAG: hypothetical protein GX942_00580 [Papillibacter sp.]|jgi:hypothetical protein|nr:hypothetical protein [Papillibacter sp.]